MHNISGDWRKCLLALAITLIFLFITGWYLSTYDFVPVWDQIGYWGRTLRFNSALDQHPVHTALYALQSVNVDDYNQLQSWIMSLAVRLLPTWKGTFFAELALVSVPVSLLLTAYIIGLVGRDAERAFIPCYVCILFFPTLLYPVLGGYLDEVGVLLFVAVVVALTDESLLEGWGKPFASGVSCFGLLCIRRWFVYGLIGIVVYTLLWWAIYLARRKGDRKRAIARVGKAALFVAAGGVLTAIPFLGFVKHSLSGGYSAAYASWRWFGGYTEKVADLVGAFGWGWLLLGAVSYLFFAVGTRSGAENDQKILTSSPSAFIATVAAVFTFWQTQDLSAQHRYIFTPFLIIAMAAPIVAALEHRSDTARKACAFLLPAFGVTGFLFSFSVLPAPATAIPLFTGSTLMSPLQQGDVEEKEQLVNYLNDVVTTNDSVYFASASINVNSTLVESVNLSMGNVDDSMNVCSADVDSRDGFNTGFFDCDYVVAAVPTQYHMRPENERVVGALSEGVSDSLSVVGSHYEAMRSFNMDGDAKVTVYRKIRDYTDDEVRQLQKQFDGFYPDLPELFHDRFDTYLANR